ncbi:diol dehydratase small subunit [uncultured Secundilactobacillus sp.]|uniref:diol dehydratase small subunit n=1 Tax=uncultured Secundilactobacillus sp. TaxID=2813935 RepID=UPI00258D4539|nr:diol dehydratase small subunit [uncultured Secundilactobacillus sp.]
MSEIDDLVAKVAQQLQSQSGTATSGATATTHATSGKGLGASDYPLYKKHPELVKSPSGQSLDDITIDNVLSGKVGSKDLRITSDTLQYQGEIADHAGRSAIQRNMARAAELTAIPDDRLLEMYGALRPYRSSKQDLLDISEELATKYHAPICSGWFKEAAQYYEKNKKLKGDN